MTNKFKRSRKNCVFFQSQGSSYRNYLRLGRCKKRKQAHGGVFCKGVNCGYFKSNK